MENLLKIAEDFEDASAQYNLGIICRDQEDLEKAVYWLTLSAEQGAPLAQYNLGVILDKQGKLQEAAHWYKLAAEQGMP